MAPTPAPPSLRARGQTRRGVPVTRNPLQTGGKLSGTIPREKFAPQWLVARDRLAPAGALPSGFRVARGGRRAWSRAPHHRRADGCSSRLRQRRLPRVPRGVSRCASRPGAPASRRRPARRRPRAGACAPLPTSTATSPRTCTSPWTSLPPPARRSRDASRPSSRSRRPSAPSAATRPRIPSSTPTRSSPTTSTSASPASSPYAGDARTSLLAALRRALASLDAFHADVGPSFRGDPQRRARHRVRRVGRVPTRAETETTTTTYFDRFRAMVRAVDEALDARGYPVSPPTGAARRPVVVSEYGVDAAAADGEGRGDGSRWRTCRRTRVAARTARGTPRFGRRNGARGSRRTSKRWIPESTVCALRVEGVSTAGGVGAGSGAEDGRAILKSRRVVFRVCRYVSYSLRRYSSRDAVC